MESCESIISRYLWQGVSADVCCVSLWTEWGRSVLKWVTTQRQLDPDKQKGRNKRQLSPRADIELVYWKSRCSSLCTLGLPTSSWILSPLTLNSVLNPQLPWFWGFWTWTAGLLASLVLQLVDKVLWDFSISILIGANFPDKPTLMNLSTYLYSTLISYYFHLSGEPNTLT